jgi:uncharacterized protein (TIGR01319 family)
MKNIVALSGIEDIAKKMKTTSGEIELLIDRHMPIPKDDRQKAFVEILTEKAVSTSLSRHAGRFRDLYSSSGRKKVAEGKDLTNIKYIIGTGGALTRLPNNIHILENALASGKGNEMYPSEGIKILIDHYYIMASVGVMSKEYPEAALQLMENSLQINTESLLKVNQA